MDLCKNKMKANNPNTPLQKYYTFSPKCRTTLESKPVTKMSLEKPRQLPDEIIVNVLLRLRVKPLLRCKSVSKSWYSFISDPHFVKSHFKLSTTDNDYVHHRLMLLTTEPDININTCSLYDVLYDHSNTTLEEFDYPLKEYPMKESGQDFSIVGSCNGLFCIVNGRDNVFIWNPSTRKCKKLPNCDSKPWLGSYGFGYDESSDDYKVVALHANFKGKVKIYSLRTGKWKIISDFPRCIAVVSGYKFLNGAFYWMVYGYEYSEDVIVSLDLANETYGIVSRPVCKNISRAFGFWVLGQQLCMTCSYNSSCTDVWVMKSKDSWTKLVSIPYPIHCWNNQVSMPLCISNDGKLLMIMKGKFGLYDPSDTSFSEFKNYRKDLRAFTFVENLVSLDGVADDNNDGN